MMLSGSSEHFLQEDAAHLMDVYKEVYNEVSRELSRPNVLVTGITGAGKSSFINAIFGSDMAKVGEGTPITQHFHKYHPANKPIVLYDSKGLENGKAVEFIETTKEFFGKHKKGEGGDISNCIHVVWYIVNSAMARFQEFEKLICTELFHNVPIIFILNKKDISTDEQRKAIRKEIESMHLENCYGIIDTDASHKQCIMDFDACPKCGDEDIVIVKKRKLLTCQACGHSQSILRKNGLSDVIKTTINVLPVIARESFISAQGVAFHLKEDRAKAIIKDFAHEFEIKVRHKKVLMTITARALTRLSILWEFREHGNLYGVDMAKHMVASFGFRDNVMLFLHKNEHQMYTALALCVLWNRSLRSLAQKLFSTTAGIAYGDTGTGESWEELIHASFTSLKQSNLLTLEKDIEEDGLDAVLDAEMPPFKEMHADAILTSQCLAAIEDSEGSFVFSGRKATHSEPAMHSDMRRSGSAPSVFLMGIKHDKTQYSQKLKKHKKKGSRIGKKPKRKEERTSSSSDSSGDDIAPGFEKSKSHGRIKAKKKHTKKHGRGNSINRSKAAVKGGSSKEKH